MTPRFLRCRVRPVLLLLAATLSIAGCGGGTSDPAPTVSVGGSSAIGPTSAAGTPGTAGTSLTAGASCTLGYALTASPLLTGLDPLLDRQWHLNNTGQSGGLAGQDLRVFDAWTVTKGAGVRIAVIDDAVEITHPDLRPNLVDGASHSYRAGNPNAGWPLPCTVSDEHGTAVAGIALSAGGNGIGGAGVAPLASLVAYDALTSGLDSDVADALTRGADVNGVYQNSWGSPDDGGLHASDAPFDAAIEQGIATGRGGLGSVFVFAGGNGGCYRRDARGACYSDDSNYDGYVNHRGVIAVCGVDDTGRQPSFGEPGANLTVCAPASGALADITTTALKAGYRSDFTGSSASTPMVSGIVALMLAANPRLTWRDVRLILARSARRNDPTDADWIASRSGPAFNHKYGFGVADAAAAVATARGWTSVGGASTLRRCDAGTATPNAPLPDRTGARVTAVDSDLVVTACPITRIEFVEIRLTAPHAYAGNLRVRLRSPSETTSRLAEARRCEVSCGSYDNWRFGSMRHLDEPANGVWTLQVADDDADTNTGTFLSWSLVVYGR